MENENENHSVARACYDLGAGNYPSAAYQLRIGLSVGEDVLLRVDSLVDHDHGAFVKALADMGLNGWYDENWLVIERPVVR